MKYFVKDLEKILNAKKINLVDNKEITGIAIDSRKVKEGDLFIPFLGENVDGHDYIESAFEKGAVASLSLKDDFESENRNTENGKTDGKIKLKLKFNEEQVDKPYIAEIIKKYNAEINILGGSIDKLSDTVVGHLIVEIIADDEEIRVIKKWLEMNSVELEVL